MDMLQINQLLQELSNNQRLQNVVAAFIKQYGIPGIEQALRFYSDLHQEYVCKTKNSISKFNICDILYLEIHGHNISVHTNHGIYQKYGTLKKELEFLSSYGFVKCSQNCIVSTPKIRTIRKNDIILIDGTKIHLSHNYTSAVIINCYQNKLFSCESVISTHQ